MQLKYHPYFKFDVHATAHDFWVSLTTGKHWDTQLVSLLPSVANAGSEHVKYTLDACYTQGLTQTEDLDPQSQEALDVLKVWCDKRAVTCATKLGEIETVDFHYIEVQRMIACQPQDLRPNLGIFWTHDLENWPDPYPLWAEGERDQPTLVVTGLIGISDIDWQTSLMSHMCWMLGDCEAEIRVKSGVPVKMVDCSWLHDGSNVTLPRIDWFT